MPLPLLPILLGAGVGAFSNQDDPLKGALMGGATGGIGASFLPALGAGTGLGAAGGAPITQAIPSFPMTAAGSSGVTLGTVPEAASLQVGEQAGAGFLSEGQKKGLTSGLNALSEQANANAEVTPPPMQVPLLQNPGFQPIQPRQRFIAPSMNQTLRGGRRFT